MAGVHLHFEGNIVRFMCNSTGKSLRIRNAQVDGNGGEGDFAKFIVHTHGAYITLQSFKEKLNYLAIKAGILTVGSGGENCYFSVVPSDHDLLKMISLESKKFPGHHVGILPNGSPKNPANTGRGAHASFTVYLVQSVTRDRKFDFKIKVPSVFSNVKNAASNLLSGSGSTSDSNAEAVSTAPVQNITYNISSSTYHDPSPPAPMEPSYPPVTETPYPPVTDTSHPPVTGTPVPYPPVTGTPYPPVTGTPYPPVSGTPYPPITGTPYPPQPLSFQPTIQPMVYDPHHQQRSAKSASAFILQHGSIIQLQCLSTKQTLRFHENGTIDGTGGAFEKAQFLVLSRGLGLVSFQWVVNEDKYLSITNGMLTQGEGDTFCIFTIHESNHDPTALCFESVMYPGCYIGITPDGNPKLSSQTKRGPHGSFKPIFIKEKILHYPISVKSLSYWVLSHGTVVFLTSCSYGKTLQINPSGQVDCNGAWEDYAKWIVEIRGNSGIAFRNFKQTAYYLEVTEYGLLAGSGRLSALLKPHPPANVSAGHEIIMFTSAKFPHLHLRVSPSGDVLPPSQVDYEGSANTQFSVSVVEKLLY